MTFEIVFSEHIPTFWKRFFGTFLYTATCTVVNFLWSSNIGCVFCGSELTDSWKRTKLNGKVSHLPDRISSVLNVPLSNINVDGLIYNECSYRDLKRLGKILEYAKSLQPQSFTTNNRTKCCVLSDSRISPSVSVPLKSPRHAMDQGSREGRTFCFDVIISATIFARRKSAGGNTIGLNQQRKSHASSSSFGGWVWAHFPEQQLVIEPNIHQPIIQLFRACLGKTATVPNQQLQRVVWSWRFKEFFALPLALKGLWDRFSLFLDPMVMP